MFRRITAWMLLALLCVQPVLAAREESTDTPTEAALPGGIAVDAHQQAIAEHWESLTPEDVDIYLPAPQPPAEPDEPAEPDTPDAPITPEQPTDPEQPAEPDTPADPQLPVEPETPAELEQSTEPEQPAEPDQPIGPEAPVVNPNLPSVTAPYAIGQVNPDYLESGLHYLNFLRQLAGLSPVTLSDHLNVQAQYGAVLLAANDVLSHTPDKPADMDSAFFRMGANACAAGNLSMRYGYAPETLLQSALQGHMDEDSALNRLDLGHRRWLLNPELGKVGFGIAASATGRQYIAVPVTDRSSTVAQPPCVLWPAEGEFPNNVFSPGTPWSISLDDKRFSTPVESLLQVTVTRHRDGKVFHPALLDGQAQLNEEGSYLLVSTKAYGSGSCISFSIGKTELGADSYLGEYTVKLSGLFTRQGQPAVIEYTVNFFDAEQLSQPSDWALEEVAEAYDLSLIPEELTDFYQQPITRLEYCRLTMQVLRQKTGLTTEELVEKYHLLNAPAAFSDCDDPEVAAAAAIGAVFGPGDGTFRPEGLITRQDAAVMLLQASAAVGMEVRPMEGLLYADSDKIAPYARLAVMWTSAVRDSVSAMPVMAGVGGGKFDPMGTYTREQAMLTALRLFRAQKL